MSTDPTCTCGPPAPTTQSGHRLNCPDWQDSDTPADIRSETPTANPAVQGHCPGCGATSLFLRNGGYITCARIDCPQPDAASTLLERDPRATPATCGLTTPGIGNTPLGPCIHPPHGTPVHQAANGARWWTADGVVYLPGAVTDEEAAAAYARWQKDAGKPVLIITSPKETTP